MKIYYSDIKQYLWIVLVCILLALGVGFYLAKVQSAKVQASSIIFVDAGTPNSFISPLGGSTDGLNKSANYAVLITSRSVMEFVYQSDHQLQERGFTLDDLIAHVNASPSAATATITITVTATTTGDAMLLANDVAKGFSSYVQVQYQAELDSLSSDLQNRLALYQKQKNTPIVDALESQLSSLPLIVLSDIQIVQTATPANVIVSRTPVVLALTAGAGL